MTCYLFSIKPVDYAYAEKALQGVGCWLEGPKDKAVVACSSRQAHIKEQMVRAAEEALEYNHVMVYR